MRNSSFMSRFQDWLGDWSEGKTRSALIVVLAVLVGLLAALLLYTIMKVVIYDVFPRPPSIDYSDKIEAKKLLDTDPVGAYWVLAISWLFSTVVGSYCTARLAKMGQFTAWIAGIVMGAFYLCDLFFQPHTPLIFVVCPILVGLAAWGGGWLGMYVNVRKQMHSERTSAPVITPEVVDTLVE